MALALGEGDVLDVGDGLVAGEEVDGDGGADGGGLGGGWGRGGGSRRSVTGPRWRDSSGYAVAASWWPIGGQGWPGEEVDEACVAPPRPSVSENPCFGAQRSIV